jgi:hypothetical protein
MVCRGCGYGYEELLFTGPHDNVLDLETNEPVIEACYICIEKAKAEPESVTTIQAAA